MSRKAKLQYEHSQGSVALAKLGQPQETIAARLHVSRCLVSMWLSGFRSPGKGNREQMKAAYSIDPKLWDTPLVKAPAPSIPPPCANPPAPAPGLDESVEDKARRLANMIDGIMVEVANDKSAASHEKGRVLRGCTASLQLLGKLTGEMASMSESRILRLPSWRAIEEALGDALRPWPDAMRSVGEALRKLHGEPDA